MAKYASYIFGPLRLNIAHMVTLVIMLPIFKRVSHIYDIELDDFRDGYQWLHLVLRLYWEKFPPPYANHKRVICDWAFRK